MTEAFFKDQVRRLRTRFGDKAFDTEFVLLVWREVRDMSEAGFARAVEIMIGSRTPLKSPLLSDFREARLNEEKLKLQNDLRGAAQILNRKAPEEMRRHLNSVLGREYGATDSVVDALEIARLRKLREGGKPDGAA